MMKVCNKCGVEKPITSFHKNQKAKEGRRNTCSSCVVAYNKTYVAANKEKVAAQMREYHKANRDKLLAQMRAYRERNRDALLPKQRKRGSGFSDELFYATLSAQGGVCGICSVDLTGLERKAIHADHCHESGHPRGVLCKKCNIALGGFNDDPVVLKKALAYLENPPITKVQT
jgi:hypothetical protein